MDKNLDFKSTINTKVIYNFSKLKLTLFLLPLFFLSLIVLFLCSHGTLSIDKYIEIQKEFFFYINTKLAPFSYLIYNLTQFGDALICLSFFTLFIIYAPKIWEALISALIVSALFSVVLKKIFLVPRPAAVFDNTTFKIVGKTISGHNSLPSGHSITIFTIFTILLFAFMPKKWKNKLLWFFLVITTALIIAFTRVGVGAHYPLDVIIGSIIGYISGISGILINRKLQIWRWINNKKSYPFFIALFVVCSVLLVVRIFHENLVVFYMALTSLIVSLYKFIYVYFKK
jgi:membrane-associated phospholipid phosphatase